MIARARADWLETLEISNTVSPVTFPLHLAIVRQLEAGPGSTWVSGWAAACEIDPATEADHLAIATAFYRERLLLAWEAGYE